LAKLTTGLGDLSAQCQIYKWFEALKVMEIRFITFDVNDISKWNYQRLLGASV
jgi:hypothetical protein